MEDGKQEEEEEIHNVSFVQSTVEAKMCSKMIYSTYKIRYFSLACRVFTVSSGLKSLKLVNL